MKLVLLGLSVLVYGCSDQPDSSSGGNAIFDETKVDSINSSTTVSTEKDNSKKESFSVMAYSYSDLPECNDDRESALSYVKSEKAFYVCEYGSWDIIDMGVEEEEKAQQLVVIDDELPGLKCKTGGKVIHVGFDNNNDGKLSSYEYESSDYVCNGVAGEDGQDGANGINGEDGQDGANGIDGTNGVAIEGIYNISASSTNYCTYWGNESCYFRGGQVIKYSDGSSYIIVDWTYHLVDTGNYDTNDNSISFFIPADWSASSLLLSNMVAISSTYKSVFLYYNNDTNTAKLIFDSDNDSIVESTDATLEWLTISEQ